MIDDDELAVAIMLANLPQPDSDALRSERVRARCHKILERKRATTPRDERRPVRLQHVFEFVVVGGFCIVYLSAVTALALQTRGWL